MNTETIQKFIKEACKNATQKGFHDEHHSDKHYIALIITELSEMVEAHRKNKRCALDAEELLKLSTLTDENAFVQEFECNVKDTYEDEIADVAIRVFDLAGLRGISLVSVEDSFKELGAGVRDFETEEVITGSLGYLSNLTVTEFLYEIITNDLFGCETHNALQNILERVILWTRLNEIDLETHIRLKMRYNATRPALHGKRWKTVASTYYGLTVQSLEC